MKLTKLLAMLLALCMILCCFAACGGDKKDDAKDEKTEATDAKKEENKEPSAPSDKGDETDKKDDKEETKKEEPKADAELEGKWMMDIDMGKAFMGMMEDEEIEFEIPSLEFGIEWTFEADGEYIATAVEFPDEDVIYNFYMSFMEQTMSSLKDMLGGEDMDSYLADMGYETWDEYVEASVQDAVDMMIESMHEEPDIAKGEYELDGDVIKFTDDVNGVEGEISFEIDGDEMTFVKVEDDMEALAMLSGAKLIKK